MSVHTHTRDSGDRVLLYLFYARNSSPFTYTRRFWTLDRPAEGWSSSTGGEEVELKHLHSMLTIFALTLAHARSPISTLQWHYIYVKCAQTATNSSPPVAVIAAPCVHLAGKTVFGRVCSGWVAEGWWGIEKAINYARNVRFICICSTSPVNNYIWCARERSAPPQPMLPTTKLMRTTRQMNDIMSFWNSMNNKKIKIKIQTENKNIEKNMYN